MARYAVYFSPRPGTPLHTFGRDWFGFDPETGDDLHYLPISGMTTDEHAAMVATPRHYALHGTLKPPFSLKPETSDQDLKTAVDSMAYTFPSFSIDRLALRPIGGFLALVPNEPSTALLSLAERCVRDLDSFRLPPAPEELERRRRAALTPPQEENLKRWGYPYVMDEFRFHITLTGRIGAETATELAAKIAPRLKPVLSAPLPIQDLCIFTEPEDGTPMRLWHRVPLSG
ncbi:MAG: DUF1045 domain-containing protein [Alphaproteobacteria bacterium]